MKRIAIFGLGVAVLVVCAGSAAARNCSPDAVRAGSVCMDKYEASVWSIPAMNPGGGSNAGLIRRVGKGTATQAQLTAGGATQLGVNGLNDYPCLANGHDCKDLIYAASLPNVAPSGSITWFQAQMACGNSNKRLPNNAEWQLAATGTPDPGTDNGTTDCKLHFGGTADDPVPSGSRSSCVSAWGAFDMVGNVLEWVADWTARSQNCLASGWTGGMNSDLMCLIGVDTSVHLPGALLRGGRFGNDGATAGYFAITGDVPPNASSVAGGGKALGFRCAREP